LPKRYHTISIILIILVLIAMVGYLSPAGDRETSVRILIDDCGGKVVFSHLAHHRDYKITCVKCHHEKNEGQADHIACGLCHPVTFNQNYIENHKSFFPDKNTCVRCHHLEFFKAGFEHSEHEGYASDCTDCHHESDIEPEPQACKSCHLATEGQNIPNLKNATHDCCMRCHEDFFEKGFKGCSDCHAKKDMKKFKDLYSSCLPCHQVKKIKQLLPTRTDAFHKQCLSCHQELKKGPFGENSCNKCHFK
jgi:hypothetical protein